MEVSAISNGMSEECKSYTVTTTITKLSAQETFKQNGNHDSNLLKSFMDPHIITNGNKTSVQETTMTTRTETKQGAIIETKTNILATPHEAVAEPFAHTIRAAQAIQVVNTVKYLNGPDQVIPCDALSTTSPDGQVKLAIADDGIGAIDPLSVPGLLHRTAQNFPNTAALVTKNEDGTWKKITFGEYEAAVRMCAKAFLKLGLKRYHSVCILGFNSPQWFISDLAAIYAGGFAAGIYTTNSPEACFHCAQNSRANIIVVEDNKQLDKILKIRDRLPELKAIVQYEDTPVVEGVFSWDDLMKIGSDETDEELEKTLKSISINECCTLVYTSGTVGNPKAVMLSHDNMTWTAGCIASKLSLNNGSEVIVSYLPLSHVAAQVLDIFITISCAVTVYFADKNALKGTLVQTLQEARPTQFLGVPRVWEKMSEKMMHVGNQAGGIKKAIASWAKNQGLQHNMDKMKGVHSNSFRYVVANMLIFRRIKRVLGLDRCQNFFSSAAPLSIEVKKYFMSLDMPIMEVFGMSESSGPHTLALASNYKLDSIGKTLPGLQTVIHKQDDEEEGEICMGGRNVFMGYLHDAVKTQETIDDQGFLHSGDIGREDKDGFLYITGRIKELIITAGGENVPPVLIEHTLKGELPCLSNVVLIGDKRKFLSVLLTLKTEVNSETGEPLDDLSAVTKAWCKDIGSSSRTVSDILSGPDEKVMAAIQQGIDQANTKAISNAQKIQKFSLLPKDFSIPTGEMGPTMKLKRNVVSTKYADTIERSGMNECLRYGIVPCRRSSACTLSYTTGW